MSDTAEFDPEQEHAEEHEAHRAQVFAEDPKRRRVQIAQPAGVHLIEIAMGHFAGEDPAGRLCELSFVVRNPTAIQTGVGEQPSEKPDDRDHSPVLDGWSHATVYDTGGLGDATR